MGPKSPALLGLKNLQTTGKSPYWLVPSKCMKLVSPGILIWYLHKEKVYFRAKIIKGCLFFVLFCFRFFFLFCFADGVKGGWGVPNQNRACFVCYLKMTNTWLPWSKLSEKLKNGINFILGSPVVLELLIKTCRNIVLINNSRTAWPTKISMLFLSPSDNLLQDACIIFLWW